MAVEQVEPSVSHMSPVPPGSQSSPDAPETPQCSSADSSGDSMSSSQTTVQHTEMGMSGEKGHPVMSHPYLPLDQTSVEGNVDPVESKPWRPSLFRIGPLVGLTALLVSFLQMFASYGILKGSDGDLTTNWKYQPTVYLAIFATVSNKSLIFATVQGTIISFWRRALSGTTLAQLHRDWGHGSHVYKAMLAGRHFSLLALACICATFVAIDAPLLQRASSVHSTTPELPVLLQVSIAPELPRGFTGNALYDSDKPREASGSEYSNDFHQILRDCFNREPIRSEGGITGCSGTCHAVVRAPALAVDRCTTELVYRNYSLPPTAEEEKIMHYGIPPKDRNSFMINWSPLNGTYEEVVFETDISDEEVTKTCAGHVNITKCYMRSAIGEYTIHISNDDIITFDEQPSYPRIVARANNTAMTQESQSQFGLCHNQGGFCNSTLVGLSLGMAVQYGGALGFLHNMTTDGITLLEGGAAWLGFGYETNYDDHNNCAPSWNDPRDSIMIVANELMFRSGLYASQRYNDGLLQSRMDEGLAIHTNVTGKVTSPVNVFAVDYRFFAAAAAIELFTIVVILFTFYGFWLLGRNATLSPLEIAKAFDAPLLTSVPSNLNGNRIEKLVDEHKVQYGDLSEATSVERIVLTDKDLVHYPLGTMYSLLEDLARVRRTMSTRRQTIRRRRSATSSEA